MDFSLKPVHDEAGGADREAAGLTRPTSTWTYLVQDNPFGSEWERIVRRLSSKTRS